MKFLFLFLFLFCLLHADRLKLNKSEKQWIKEHPEVLFTGDPNWLPFEAIDSEGNYIGIVADYLKIVQEQTGLNLILKPVKSWTETLEVASKQQVSIVSGDVADITLNKSYKPIEPYIINPIVVLMRHDANYVEDLHLLSKKKIVLIKGYGYTADLFEQYPDINFIEVDNVQEGLLGLSLKKYDVMLASESLAYYTIRKMNLTNIKLVGKTRVVMEVTLFVRKSEKVLYGILNKVIHAIPLAKKHNIINKWRDVKELNGKDSTIWFLFIVGFITIVVLMYVIRRLYKSQNYYKEVLEINKGTLWSWDIKSGEIFFSQGSRKMMGLSEDVVSADYAFWMEHIHPDDKKAVSELIEDNLSGKTDDFIIDYRILHVEGHWVWVSIKAKTAYGSANEALRMDGVCRDVSVVKEHQVANEQSIKRLESAQEIGHLGSWDWNIKTGDLRWSDEVYRIFGEVPQSFPATYEGFKSYIPTEYQEGLEKAIGDAMETKLPYEYDHEVLRKDGTKRLVREAGYVLFDDNDEPQFMFGTILDINTVVEVSTTKRENREMNELLEKFDQNVIASNTDLEGIITYASQAFVEISGYSHEELMGHSQNIVRHPDMPSVIYKDLWDTIQSGETWSGELKNRKKDGSAYWVYNTISLLKNEKGKPIGYSAIRQDLTHEKEAEALHESLELKTEELITLNKELEYRIDLAVLNAKDKDHLMAQQSKLASMGEMIGNIAHQWRQPLNALALILQKQQLFFDRGLLDTNKMQESTNKGIALVNKMSTTIDDFRDFFKPNKEKMEFDVKIAIENSLELIEGALYNQSIAIELDIEDNQFLFGYKNEFSQVILNIINNAKDALAELKIEQPVIKIKSYTQEEKVYVEIEDNGGGIKQQLMEHIFEPYFTTKEEGKGTGIGLYMSKMIIEENMDGSIEVNNGNAGAKFSIIVPKAKKISEAL